MTVQDSDADLAPYYRLIYGDWEAAGRRQVAMLHEVIRELRGGSSEPQECSALDAACGIGTQSLALAQLGYWAIGSDISPGAAVLAREEATNRGLQLELRVADMRNLWAEHRHEFDVVLAYDNAIPHLAGEGDILTACQQFYRCTSVGGLCLLSLRDYASMQRDAPGAMQVVPRLAHGRQWAASSSLTPGSSARIPTKSRFTLYHGRGAAQRGVMSEIASRQAHHIASPTMALSEQGQLLRVACLEWRDAASKFVLKCKFI